MAINQSHLDRDGKRVENPCFVDVELWDRLADAMLKYTRKGSLILVEGRLQSNEWKTEDGQSRSRLKVQGDRIQFLDRSPNQKRTETNRSEPVSAGGKN